MLGSPDATELGNYVSFGDEPQPLCVDQGAVHVDQDGLQRSTHVALKYFASG